MRSPKIGVDNMLTDSYLSRHENSKLEKCGNGQHCGQATQHQSSGNAQNDRKEEVEKSKVLIRTTHDSFRPG